MALVESNLVEAVTNKRTIAAKCHIRIKGNSVTAVLDSGAAVSIITKRLIKNLGLEIDSLLKIVVVIMNRTKERAIGQINKVNIIVHNIMVPMKLQVIESLEETLLLGTDWFEKTSTK
ncbi:gag-pol fusion protein [Gigaspora margarita]|uniref:Gag-pol fusion protein n=1 Tax=Gigaspora margarita TaxID=4874 RepID=A0A8H3XL33_GIGMA|nr:gag-pol fusion protein [Gigaspora margarita]